MQLSLGTLKSEIITYHSHPTDNASFLKTETGYLIFSESMNTDTLNGSNITVQKVFDGSSITINFGSYNDSETKVTFTFIGLEDNTQYRLTVTTGVCFADGTPIRKGREILFRVPFAGVNFDEFYKEKTFGDDPDDPNYIVVFEDDFDTPFMNEIQTHDAAGSVYTHITSPDPAKWDAITDFVGNGWYKAENSYIDSDTGRLVIKAESKDLTFNHRPNAMPQTTGRVAGRIQSKEKFGFLYGKVTTKFKASKGASWPAIWFITNSEKFRDELDMLEYYPHKNTRD